MKLNTLKEYVLSTFLLFSVVSVSAQSSSSEKMNVDSAYKLIEKIYGPDQSLVNGVYFENIYKKDLGYPYLWEDNFKDGYIIYKDKLYSGLLLKYNIFDQTVLVSYKTPYNQHHIFVPSNEFTTEFSFSGKVFRRFTIAEKGNAFYQVVYDGEIKCLYYWYKQRDESYHEAKYLNYIFLDDKKKTYLLIENNLERYKSKPGFIRIFPKFIRKDIKSYIKTNKINFNTADDKAFSELVSFCDSLLIQYSNSEKENLDN